MKNIKKVIGLLAIGLFIAAVPVQAQERTVTHFGNEFTLEEWLTVGPGRHYRNDSGREHQIRSFEQAWERQQRTGRSVTTEDGITVTGSGNVTITVNGNTVIDNRDAATPEQPAVVTPSPTLVPVQPVAPTTPIVNDSIPEGVAVSNLSNRPEEFANHQMLEVELEVLRLVNEIRVEHGLQPLILDLALSVAARSHSEDMSVNQFLSHTGSDGSSVAERKYRVGVPRTLGIQQENAGRGRTFAAFPTLVVDRWMDSPMHRTALLGIHTTHVGLGFYNDSWTAKFSNPSPERARW